MNCRLCNSKVSKTVVDLGGSPVSNAFLKEDQLEQMEPYFPLHVRVCESCYLVQIPDVAGAEHHFHDDYVYFSSFSKSWVEHAKSYVDQMIDRWGLDETSQVIEVASNDGYLLQHFVNKQVPVLGIEPSANVAKTAEEKGIETWVKFFGRETAQAIVDKGYKADLIAGNNVVAHVPDINDFISGFKIALKSTGVITLEFPHLMELMKNNQFDTIYHEHFSYFSLRTIMTAFEKHGMRVFDADQIETHGGSLRVFACHKEAQHERSSKVESLLSQEEQAGLFDIKTYEDFQQKVSTIKNNLLHFLLEAKKNHHSVAAYGAAAKGNTLLNYIGAKPDLISFCVDANPHKQSKFLPGTHIPVLSPEELSAKKPDYVLILPWNIKSEIIDQVSYIKDWGGSFVVPIPELEVIR